MLNLTEMAETGHLTKLFDGRPIPEDKIETLLELLRSAPTSLNLQGTHYLVAGTHEGKKRIAKSMEGMFEANMTKVSSASHVIAFCTRADIPGSYLDEIQNDERSNGRFPPEQVDTYWETIVRPATAWHQYELKDLIHWLQKQTYMHMGMALMAAASLGIDAAPLEGFFPAKLDEEFGLRKQGLTGTLLLALGYRSKDDIAVGKPKSRRSMKNTVTRID